VWSPSNAKSLTGMRGTDMRLRPHRSPLPHNSCPAHPPQAVGQQMGAFQLWQNSCQLTRSPSSHPSTSVSTGLGQLNPLTQHSASSTKEKSLTEPENSAGSYLTAWRSTALSLHIYIGGKKTDLHEESSSKLSPSLSFPLHF